jgi:hypothetical protein
MYTEGIFEIASFDFIPWGNAYFGGVSGDTEYCQTKNTEGCNKTEGSHLWLDACGPDATQPVSDDCWAGATLCQHGPNECTANLIENCVVNKVKPQEQPVGKANSMPEFWEFIACFESHTIGRDPSKDADVPRDNAYTCALQLVWDADDIEAVEQCAGVGTHPAQGSDKEEREKAAAQRTARLSPRHSGTPYILVNGKSTGAGNVLKEVCNAYNGPKPKPAACSGL